MAFSGNLVPIALDHSEKICYESAMKTPDAHTFPQTSGVPQSLEEVLEVCFAENERLNKLVDEQRQEIITLQKKNVALEQENLVPAHGVAEVPRGILRGVRADCLGLFGKNLL